MTSFSFPDVNVWFALAAEEHIHHDAAVRWWEREEGWIAFCRITQMGLLRLLTTSAAMNGQPLNMRQAWRVVDSFHTDDRVSFAPEPPAVEVQFRQLSRGAHASPKLWTDAFLLAFASEAGATIVTFDKGLAGRAGVPALA